MNIAGSGITSALAAAMREPGVERVEGGLVEGDGPFGVELAERDPQPAAGGSVVDDAVELDVGRRTRRISRRMRRALVHRDRCCCFPGCDRPGAQAHHKRHWSNGGPTTPDNLVLLCRRHHTRVHEGGYHVRTDRAGRHRFYHPQGWEILPVAQCIPPTDDPIPTDVTYSNDWDGTLLRLGDVVEGLLQTDGLLCSPPDSGTSRALPGDIWRSTRPPGAAAQPVPS